MINLVNSKTGQMSKYILRKINDDIGMVASLSLCCSIKEVISWFNINQERGRARFTQFNTINSYPLISKVLLMKALSIVKRFTDISDRDINVIMQARKTVFFQQRFNMVKQFDHKGSFDVTMGVYDSTNIYNLIGQYILDTLGKKFLLVHFVLYRNEALAISSRAKGHTLDRFRKDQISTLNSMRFKITIKIILTTVDFQDVTLDLGSGTYKSYCKSN